MVQLDKSGSRDKKINSDLERWGGPLRIYYVVYRAQSIISYLGSSVYPLLFGRFVKASAFDNCYKHQGNLIKCDWRIFMCIHPSLQGTFFFFIYDYI